MRLRATTLLIVAVAMLAQQARASGPRWTTGPPYFAQGSEGRVVIWYTDQPLYYTDPGDLSTSVDHAAADALVAEAASIWNLPQSRIVLQQGGALDEQVSGANVYAGSNGLVFPADVDSSNYANKQIAIVYDRDGSVTDLLLGSGASSPGDCRQNAVTESVDQISTTGYIQHAVIILNGRCTGPAPEQQLQMRYQLERVFGRVLGVAWSQVNDNVFTGVPQPTASQVLHWPIMHPIDVICGPYTYQCLLQPFMLRDDDVASMVLLYPVSGTPGPGKQLSGTDADQLAGALLFPTQEGMAGVNVVVRRNELPYQVLEDWDESSAVTGIFNAQLEGNPITPKPPGLAGSQGFISQYYDLAGFFYMPWIPLHGNDSYQDLFYRTEPINSLYTGTYSIGPYQASVVTPSGDLPAWHWTGLSPGCCNYTSFPVANSPGTCPAAGADGTEGTPAPIAASGWWSGLFCETNNTYSHAHTSWRSLPVQANRSFTVEVTALDTTGNATPTGARPVIGIWNGNDPTGTTPTVAAMPVALNSVVSGTTALAAASASGGTFRVAIADERGDGRPDYNYRARVLYADSITPATSHAGTQITIAGMGFRPGNTVTFNGVTATVANWTANSMTATVPFLTSVPPGTTATVDVVVSDPSTEGATVMTGAFQYIYSVPAYTMVLVSGATTDQPVGIPLSPIFSVKLLNTDGVTPMAGVPVVFTANLGSILWAGCGAATSCTATTNASGVATVQATPTAAGAVTLQAAAIGLTQTISFQAVPLVRILTTVPQSVFVAAGQTVTYRVTASASQQAQPAAFLPLSWSAAGSALTLTGVQTSTDTQGQALATVTAGPLSAGTTATAMVCAWSSICAPTSVTAVDPQQFAVGVVAGGSQSVTASGTLSPITMQVTDALGNPVLGAAVAVYQTVGQWTAPCPTQGRCPITSVYQTSSATMISDVTGAVTISPLQVAGAEVTRLVITSGNQGFAALTLQKHP